MQELKLVEFVEEPFVKLNGECYYAGERIKFPKELADTYIELGWAKCAVTGDVGTRVAGAKLIQPTNVVTTVTGS